MNINGSLRNMLLTSALALVSSSSAAFAGDQAAGEGALMWYDNGPWRDGIDSAVNAFFGQAKGTFISSGPMGELIRGPRFDPHGQLVSTQFLEVFDGIPMAKLSTKSGYTLYAFAMPHNAVLRSAVVTSPNSFQIVGAALIHFSCGMLTKAGAPVDEHSRQLNYSQPCTVKHSASLFFDSKAESSGVAKNLLTRWLANNNLTPQQVRQFFLK